MGSSRRRPVITIQSRHSRRISASPLPRIRSGSAAGIDSVGLFTSMEDLVEGAGELRIAIVDQ
jgi:hypothetical protein